VDAIKDDLTDNRILECAATARSDYIVSGDKDLLQVKSFRDIPIVKVSNFLALVAKHGRGLWHDSMMREYHAKETGRMQELDGLPLADFWQRAGAFVTDFPLAFIALTIVAFLWGGARWAIENRRGRAPAQDL
jgi:hypothetical protein